jgi:hypothetical protein
MGGFTRSPELGGRGPGRSRRRAERDSRSLPGARVYASARSACATPTRSTRTTSACRSSGGSAAARSPTRLEGRPQVRRPLSHRQHAPHRACTRPRVHEQRQPRRRGQVVQAQRLVRVIEQFFGANSSSVFVSYGRPRTARARAWRGSLLDQRAGADYMTWATSTASPSAPRSSRPTTS